MFKDVLIGRNLKGVTDREDFSLENWPRPDAGAMSPTDLALLLKRKEAVERYLQATSSATIYTATRLAPRRQFILLGPPLFRQGHFYEKPGNVFMQMDVGDFLTTELIQLILRHDYKDNHDAFGTD
ncbi:MAG TPA: hypothetical protein PLB25_08570 [Rhodoferax sp.]|nr:hypothetical protein [Rhodoferax sp.]